MKLHQIGLVTARTALTPAAIEVDNVIRIFAGFVYPDGMSRIHTIDVNPLDPGEVYAVSEKPYVPKENSDGMIPAFATRSLLFVSVFRQLGHPPFQMGVGLYSPEIATTFVNFSFSALIAGGVCFCDKQSFYARGDAFVEVGGRLKPQYEIYSGPQRVMGCEGDEYRIGKPHVWRDKKYRMLCTAYARPDNRSYLVYAVSEDGINWTRRPLMTVGNHCFASPVYAYRCGGWVFFNGAGNGVGGIGYGRLED